MDNEILVANHHIEGRRLGVRRASAVLIALTMVLALFVLVQKPADAAPKGAPVGVSAQTDFRSFVCPILSEVRDDFDDSPFFGAVVPIIDEIRVDFGCLPGATTTTRPPTTTTTVAPTTTTTVAVPQTIPPIGTSCATLLSIRNSFVGGPFAVFIPIINIAIASFGCTISG